MTALNIASPLSPDLEDVVSRTIGALLEVHRQLGPGFNERVYAAATRIELTERSISYEAEKGCELRYRGRFLCRQRVDLIIENRVVVEIKAVERIHPVHVAQVVSYLRLTACPVGLIANFNEALLKYGIKRVVL